MICFNCGHKIESSNTRECPLCGMKFTQICNVCGSLNPKMAKYCFNCGTMITDSSNQSFVQNNDKLSENRKNVAVIFADVSGFTALSEQMDPEGVREIINDCFDYITRPVYEYEGTIDKYIGDCVMILFGAKYAHYDDPKRAVLCAMKMQKLIRKYSEESLSTKGIKLEMSIGINYGLVVTGKVGNYFDKDYTVMGDVVNTAQRLQSNADKGCILVSESVFIETKDTIEYCEEKQIMVKNKKNSVKCYSPKEIKKALNSNTTLLVGREEEINTINKWYSDSNNHKCLTIIGEPGVGKTSILRSFLKDIDENVNKIWIDCNINNQNRVYNIIANIIFCIIDTQYSDSNEVKQNRLKAFINYLLNKEYSGEAIKKNFDFISLLMGLDRDSDFQSVLEYMKYEHIKEEIQSQLSIFFESLQKEHKTLIIIDGLQWADDSSIQIIKELMTKNIKLRNMFMLSSRYEIGGLNSLGDKINFTIKLSGLKNDSITQLALNYFGCNDINDAMFNVVLGLTKGNPLYIIELLNSIKRKEQCYLKDGILYLDESQAEHIPNNLEKLILENLSEFDDSTVAFLETAAVIGKEFSLSWIQSLLKDVEEETRVINLLMERNIISLNNIQLTAGIVDKNYRFKEDLTREVVYKSILNKRKVHIHKNIGEFIEKFYSKELENYYEILSLHFEKAEIDKKARKYYYKSALKYKNNFNLKDALYYYKRYIESEKIDKFTHVDLEIIRALIDIGYVYIILTEYDNAITYLNRALNLSSLSDDRYKIQIMLATIYKEQGLYQQALDLIDEVSEKVRTTDNVYGKLLQLKCNILRITGNSEVLHLVKEAEKILLQKRDFESLAEAMNSAGILYFIKGEVDNSIYYLNKAYEYAEKVNNIKVMAKVSGNLGIIYHASGLISKALENINKTIDYSKRISNIFDYTLAIGNLGIIYFEMGLLNRAEPLFNESIMESKKRVLPYQECISLVNLGDLMFERGNYEEALSLYNESSQLAIKHNLPVEEGINYLGIAKLQFKDKKYDIGLIMLEKSYKIFKEANEITYICEYHRYKSIYELINIRFQEAMTQCEKCIELAIEAKSDYKKLKGLRLKGFILAKMEKYDQAINILNESIKLSYQLESNYEIAKGYYQSFTVLYEQNLRQEANALLMKAKEAIDKTGDNRWTSIIDKTLSKVESDTYIVQFEDLS